MRALHVILISLAGSATAVGVATHAARTADGGNGRGRPGADSARVATLLTALGKTDPVVCDLIGDQLGNFWMGGEPGGLGRFADSPSGVQGAKDSLAGKITDPRAVTLLVATLSADNACVRRVAAKLLGHSNVTADALQTLLASPSPRIRESAAYAAGEGERREIRGTLEKMLGDSSAPAAMAAWALGGIEDPASGPALEGALHSTSPKVRLAAVWALGQFEDASYAKDILPLIRDPDPAMRATVAEALGQMRSPRVGAALLGALTDRNETVRRAAVSALGDIHEQSAVGPLEGLLISDGDAQVRRECASALGNLGLARSLDPLARALSDPDLEVEREAASAIEDLNDVDKAPAALVKATTASDLELRRGATKALAHIKDVATLQALADRLADADKEVRLAAVEGLGEMQVAAAIPGLTKALNDPDPEVRRAAAEALGKTE